MTTIIAFNQTLRKYQQLHISICAFNVDMENNLERYKDVIILFYTNCGNAISIISYCESTLNKFVQTPNVLTEEGPFVQTFWFVKILY